MVAVADGGQQALRQAMGHFATGVAIVTTTGRDGRPVGLTINSFASVSLDPPLVLWSLALHSPSLASFREAGGFAINVLERGQRDIALRFARPVPDKFAGLAVADGEAGYPLLDGSLAVFECRTAQLLAGGDHLIFVGEVHQARVGSGDPLVFYRGRFGDLAERWPVGGDAR